MTSRRFPSRLGRRSRWVLLMWGVRRSNAYVDLGPAGGVLEARFGWFRLRTPLANVAGWREDGPWRWLTAIGVRRSLRGGDVTFAGHHTGGVRLDFAERVRWYLFHVPALYVTPADVPAFTAALTARGIRGAPD